MGMLQRYRQGAAIKRRTAAVTTLRGNVLSTMRGTDLAKTLYELATNTKTYTLDGSRHVRLNLHDMGDGTYAAWARGDDGQFIGQVTLRPELTATHLMSVGAAAVLYISLHQIAKELRLISSRLDAIQLAIDDGANKAYQQALAYAVEALDRCDYQQMTLAELPLRQTLAQQSAALVREISALPDIREGILVQWRIRDDKSAEICRTLLGQEARLQAVFNGFDALIRLKGRSEGRRAAQRCISSFDLEDLHTALSRAEELGKKVQTRIDSKRAKQPEQAEDATINLASPWTHAATCLDVEARQIKLSALTFGKQTTLLTVPYSEVRKAFAPVAA